jgi:nucleoid-associated protein YgaU
VLGVSDTFKAANVALNGVYENRHVAEEGDTLNKPAVQYYGSLDQPRTIYLLNRTVLTTDDGNALIPPGTPIDLGVGPSIWDAHSGQH